MLWYNCNSRGKEVRMINSDLLLNDPAFAEEMLKGSPLSNADITFILRNLLRMKYYPVAVKYFFSGRELADFRKNAQYKVPVKRYTFCHHVAMSRQRGDVSLCTEDKLGCANAQYVFGWKKFDESQIKAHLKYTKNRTQARKFAKTKKRLRRGLKAVATGPLHKVTFKPDCIHGLSDVLQAYHLAIDWCAAFDTHPFTAQITVNNSACHGCVHAFMTQKPNITTMCGGSYKSGKTEQGEVSWIWPGGHLEPTVRRLLERTVRDRGASLPCTGDTYPGFDVCNLCPTLVWMKPKK